MKHSYDTEELIAALATPYGESALAVIRTSGKGCLEKISSVFKGSKNPTQVSGYTMVYGKLYNEAIPVDEVVLGIYKSPKSYTGEDMAEIFCHGSLPGINSIMDLLHKIGFRDAEPGEFTLRSFLNGKVDLTRAEAVQEIVSSRSRQAHSLALSRLSGTVFNQIDIAKHILTDVLAAVEIQLDYAEDEADPEAFTETDKIMQALNILKKLSATYKVGKLYKEGIRIALAGKTNAGKSALFNLFLKEDRSIVSDCKGTTRDYIEANVSINGLPAVLIDTAGLRESSDPVEAEGIRRSRHIIENSDIILYVIDSLEGIASEDEQFLKKYPESIVLWNKTDLEAQTAKPFENFISVSAKTGIGFDELQNVIFARACGTTGFNTGDAVIDSQRQKELLDRASDSVSRVLLAMSENIPLDVISVDLEDGINALGELTGEVTSADILENMFSHFCVGK